MAVIHLPVCLLLFLCSWLTFNCVTAKVLRLSETGSAKLGAHTKLHVASELLSAASVLEPVEGQNPLSLKWPDTINIGAACLPEGT